MQPISLFGVALGVKRNSMKKLLTFCDKLHLNVKYGEEMHDLVSKYIALSSTLLNTILYKLEYSGVGKTACVYVLVVN